MQNEFSIAKPARAGGGLARHEEDTQSVSPERNTQFMYSQELLEALASGGVFLVSGAGKPNAMTIGWGALMRIWNEPVMQVLVRQSRYTHDLLDIDPRFTVAVPKPGEFRNELSVCGVKSGRDTDKFAALSMKAAAPRNGGVPGIEGCLNIECRAIHNIHVPVQGLLQAHADNFYPEGDEHTLYFGEILAIY